MTVLSQMCSIGDIAEGLTSHNLVRKLLKGLNMFDGTNLTLISNVDQGIQMSGSREISLTYRCSIF